MTTVEWFAFSMVLAFCAGAAVATLVCAIRTGYWSNDR
jgi:hypothetical protein